MADSPSAYRRPKRRRVAKTAYDPFDEDARPQVRIQKLTQDVLKKQVRELAARVGPSQWSRIHKCIYLICNCMKFLNDFTVL